MFDILTGKLVNELTQGHFESINCCVYNPNLSELYSGGNDSQILVWSVPKPDEPDEHEVVHGINYRRPNIDYWD